ncbi:MAG: HAMP domain-containing histidine kinase [Acidobacteriota bacterium]|nr:HAMP domain-containing histidine kinase [Acidobacteriota bacterium]
MPIVGIEGAEHTVTYINPAFCGLVKTAKGQLLGAAFATIPVIGEQCAAMLERVYRTGTAETQLGRDRSELHPFWSYAMWPVLTPEGRLRGVILQVVEETVIEQNTLAMNAALVQGLIRQHELTDTADALNGQLHIVMAARQKAEDGLIRSEKLASVGRMSAVIAHEINNPLAAVMDLLYLAERVDGMPATALDYLQTADGELKRIAHITRQTLGFYRDMSVPTTFHVATLLASVIDLLKAKITSSQATVDCQCDQDYQMTAVHGELRQVISNLLANSLEAIYQNGKVTLRASPSSDGNGGPARVRITVADDGRGIGAVDLEQLFEPFFTTKGKTGNGLGLWVSKQIVEKQGGSVSVRSATNGVRRGTTFSVVLPERPVAN